MTDRLSQLEPAVEQHRELLALQRYLGTIKARADIAPHRVELGRGLLEGIEARA